MVRDAFADRNYWDKWIDFILDSIVEQRSILAVTPSKNPIYDPEYSFGLLMDISRLAMRRYSRGDSTSELKQHFPELLDAWELSNQLNERNCREHGGKNYRAWTFSLTNLDHYVWCFWLAGLALTLEIPGDQWRRLLALIGEEGKDHLLDRVIVSRSPSWKVGEELLHPRPYAMLLEAIDAPSERQGKLLRKFVNNWHKGLNRRGRERPYWYHWCDFNKRPLSMGIYFGLWCIEAAAAVKAFGLDDRLCLECRHYPADLIEDGRAPRYAQPISRGDKGNAMATSNTPNPFGVQNKYDSWKKRLFGW